MFISDYSERQQCCCYRFAATLNWCRIMQAGQVSRLQAASERFPFNVLISGSKPRFQHMSVIYIPLHRGCPHSAAACKPDEYILGINRIEELRARYPSGPAACAACGRSLHYQQLRKQDESAKWAVAAQPFSSLLPQPPLLSSSLNAFLIPGFLLKQEYTSLYVGHETTQDPPGSFSLQLSDCFEALNLIGLDGHNWNHCGNCLWDLFWDCLMAVENLKWSVEETWLPRL